MKSVILVAGVSAWGHAAHSRVGSVAQKFLDDHTKAIIASLFPEYGGVLGSNVANADDIPNWADKYKFDKTVVATYGETDKWHYVDTNDTATIPKSCSYMDSRDCPDNNCVTGAIARFTKMASCDATGVPVDAVHQKDALKFLAHLIGDITQPLHVCGKENGGNLIKHVLFDGSYNDGSYPNNFHSIWDFNIPDKRLNVDFNGDLAAYSDHLYQRIVNNTFDEQVSSFMSSTDIFAVTPNGNSDLAVEWAVDTNFFDCSKVWGPQLDNPNQDFGADYYKNVIDTVDKQVAKAGYRLGKFMNILLGQCQTTATTTASTLAVVSTTTAATQSGTSSQTKTTAAVATTTTVAAQITASPTSTSAAQSAASTSTNAVQSSVRATTTLTTTFAPSQTSSSAQTSGAPISAPGVVSSVAAQSTSIAAPYQSAANSVVYPQVTTAVSKGYSNPGTTTGSSNYPNVKPTNTKNAPDCDQTQVNLPKNTPVYGDKPILSSANSNTVAMVFLVSIMAFLL
ncbi:hypothetical protein HDV06_006608 [Boothiomyces sp. JEL0866]|nr:hypothetical protein HDV06_006608 [Boothiomyces sp. JEL0866]